MPSPSLWVFTVAVLLLFLFASWRWTRSAMPREKFQQLPSALIATRAQKVLVLVPHPDDESLAVGGYLCMCRQNGALVRLILVSDGNHRGLRDLRYREFEAAARDLGLAGSELRFWGHPDGSLKLYQDLIEAQLDLEIGQYHPNFIIYPHPADKHKDHSILGRIAEQALARRNEPGIQAFAYLIHYNFYQLPAFLSHQLQPPRSMPDNSQKWRKLILSPQARQSKRSALYKYRSQRRNPFLLPLFLVSLRDTELLQMREIAPYSCPGSSR